MALQRVNPPELGRPSGFSHAVVSEGRTVFLAGQTALDPSGGCRRRRCGGPVRAGAGEPADRPAGRGGEPEHLASLTVYIVDMDDYRARAGDIGQVWQRLVGRDYPAMAGIGVSRLWDAEALVEVQGFAVLP